MWVSLAGPPGLAVHLVEHQHCKVPGLWCGGSQDRGVRHHILRFAKDVNPKAVQTWTWHARPSRKSISTWTSNIYIYTYIDIYIIYLHYILHIYIYLYIYISKLAYSNPLISGANEFHQFPGDAEHLPVPMLPAAAAAATPRPSAGLRRRSEWRRSNLQRLGDPYNTYGIYIIYGIMV